MLSDLVDKGDIVGKCDAQLFDEETCAAVRAKELAIWAGDQITGMQETDPRIPNRRLLTTRFALSDKAGEPYAVCTISQDLTDYLSLEEQFRQAQKMEAVGRLASSVAHDFNNLLAAIIGYGELLVDQLSGDEARQNMAQQVLNAGNQAAVLTQQMLAFSRRQVLRPQWVYIQPMIDDQIELYSRLVDKHVSMTVDMCQICPYLY